VIEADVFIEDTVRWGDLDGWEERLARVVAATLEKTRFAGLVTNDALIDLSIRLTVDSEVQALNLESRGQDTPTNVLSFQFLTAGELDRLPQLPAATLGDIALAHETVAQEAVAQKKSFEAHATHLVVHGLLHLLGYDHVHDEQADVMETLERHILADLGLPDPYAVPDFHLPE
jgi:probable rRNA maturation factor